MHEQLLKTSGTDVLSSRNKLWKTLWGVASTRPPMYVRGLSLEVIGPLSVKPWCCWLWSLVSRCVLWARFYIFSCKYKSLKPSIVEYIYQVKDNILIEQQIQIERRNFWRKEEKRYSEKEFIWANSPFFSCFFFKKKNAIWRDSKYKRKIIFYALFSNLTINLLINFFFLY